MFLLLQLLQQPQDLDKLEIRIGLGAPVLGADNRPRRVVVFPRCMSTLFGLVRYQLDSLSPSFVEI